MIVMMMNLNKTVVFNEIKIGSNLISSLIDPFLSLGITSLKLSNTRLCFEDILQLVEFLKSTDNHLEVLDLSYNPLIGCEGYLLLSEGIESLDELNLRGSIINKKLCPAFFRESILGSSITKLDLSKIDMGYSNLCFFIFNVATTITDLSLMDEIITPEWFTAFFVEILKPHSSLMILNIRLIDHDVTLNETELLILIQVLINNSVLKELDMGGFSINQPDLWIPRIKEALIHNTTLVDLYNYDLRNCRNFLTTEQRIQRFIKLNN